MTDSGARLGWWRHYSSKVSELDYHDSIRLAQLKSPRGEKLEESHWTMDRPIILKDFGFNVEGIERSACILLATMC